MNSIILETFFILALIMLNGFFSMSEMSIVSARKNRLEKKAEDGDRGAAQALHLAGNPNRFLSTVQVGITLIGILSGAFGGATLAQSIAAALSNIPALAPYSETIAVVLIVTMITYLSLVLGELVPKRLAMNNAERIAARIAGFMQMLSTLATPLVSFLGTSTDFILKLARIKPSNEPAITEDDLRSMLGAGTEIGVFKAAEQDMVERVLRLADRSIGVLVTPRPDITFINVNATWQEILQIIHTHPFSRFPVYEDNTDNVLGMVRVRDLFLTCMDNQTFNIRPLIQKIPVLPENIPALSALELFKKEGTEIALVIDEYGGVAGMVSLSDVLESIIGAIAEPGGNQDPEITRREDGSLLLDGMIPVDELLDMLELDELPAEGAGFYSTLGGLVMSVIGHIPSSGEYFIWKNYRFEVIDMDQRRVDKVLITPQ